MAMTSTLILGCGGGSSGSSGGGTSAGAGGSGSGGGGGTSSGGGSGDANTLVGEFDVTMVGPAGSTPGYGSASGTVNDGATPATTAWKTSDSDGDCILRVPVVPFCSTPCGPSPACVADDTCVDYPTAKSVGTVTLTGIGASTVTMNLVQDQYSVSGDLPYPTFVAGGTVSLHAAGGDYSAFDISATGIDTLALTSSAPHIAMDTPVVVTWTPSTQASSKIELKLDIGHHGGEKGQVICDVSDAGSLTITAKLVDELLALGVAGYPSLTLTRSSTGSAVIAPGRVDLVLSQAASQEVTVAGLTSCTTDSDCPTGETCQSDLTCK